MNIKELRAKIGGELLPEEELRGIIDKKEISVNSFTEIIHQAAYDLDTAHEWSRMEDGSIAVTEQIWSMNNAHTRTIVTVDADGRIGMTGGLEAAEYLKKNGIRVR
jgi:hypothetical protein